MISPEHDHPGVIAHPPLIALMSGLVSVALHFLISDRLMFYPISFSLGIILAIAAAVLARSAERVLKASGTNIRPDHPALGIVRHGPYAYTRNPMYVSLLLLQVAVGFVFNGWIPIAFALPLALVLHFGVIRREERYLEGKFGVTYLDYKRHVRRWV